MSDDLLLVRPSSPNTPSIARISFDGDDIRVFFPEPRTPFNDVVKRMDYRWQRPYWTRTCDQTLHHDRAAELACALITAGYCVKGPRAMMETAVAQSFTPEPVRSIRRQTEGEYTDWFRIWWHKDRGGRLEDVRRGLRGARWWNGRLMVPSDQFEAILDFADKYDCHLSPGALALAEEARAEQDAAIVVDLQPLPAPNVAPVGNGRPGKLDVPDLVEIDDDLADND